MIDQNQLTADQGFVEGCVVEIIWEDYSPSIEYYVWSSAMDHPQKEYMISQYGHSVRPLTGPMAIWNFIPERINSADDLLSSEEWFQTDIGDYKRPWWARSKE